MPIASINDLTTAFVIKKKREKMNSKGKQRNVYINCQANGLTKEYGIIAKEITESRNKNCK